MGRKRIGRTPMYPEYLSYSYPDRVLALMQGGVLYVETGSILTVDNFTLFVDILFNENLMVFVESLTPEAGDFPWLYESIFYPGASVLSNEDGRPLGIRYSRSGTSRWVVPAATWDRKFDMGLLSDLRQLYRQVGICKPTPGSLGGALLRRHWSEYHLPRHTAPNVLCNDFLRYNSFGGRCDTPGRGNFYPTLLELDGASFYLAHFLQLPTGTSKRFLSNHCKQFATFFATCDVTIRKELPLGPFPVKSKRDKISYPTLPGTYRTHLWKEQIEDAEAAGCTVRIDGGYGWLDFTNDAVGWCRDMYNYRIQSGSPALETFDKKLACSAIGQFGMKNTFYRIVPLKDARDNEPCILGRHNKPLHFVVREDHDFKRPSMLHWFQYNIMQASRTLYIAALPYAIEGRLVMTNYDAILVIEQDERRRYIKKHSIESKMSEMGDWRWQELTNVTILGDRSLKCDQKTIRPGVPLGSVGR